MAFCSSFCASCRPAFLDCWATIARTKCRGVAATSRPLSAFCQGDPGVSRAPHFADLFEWRHMAPALHSLRNYALTTALLGIKRALRYCKSRLCAHDHYSCWSTSRGGGLACAGLASCRDRNAAKNNHHDDDNNELTLRNWAVFPPDLIFSHRRISGCGFSSQPVHCSWKN